MRPARLTKVSSANSLHMCRCSMLSAGRLFDAGRLLGAAGEGLAGAEAWTSLGSTGRAVASSDWPLTEVSTPESWRKQNVGRKTAHCIFETNIVLRDRACPVRQLLMRAQSVDATEIVSGFHELILESGLRARGRYVVGATTGRLGSGEFEAWAVGRSR